MTVYQGLPKKPISKRRRVFYGISISVIGLLVGLCTLGTVISIVSESPKKANSTNVIPSSSASLVTKVKEAAKKPSASPTSIVKSPSPIPSLLPKPVVKHSNPNPVHSSPTYPKVVFYKNCAEVRAAGKAPIYAGQPGYSLHLDRDKDGIACDT